MPTGWWTPSIACWRSDALGACEPWSSRRAHHGPRKPPLLLTRLLVQGPDESVAVSTARLSHCRGRFREILQGILDRLGRRIRTPRLSLVYGLLERADSLLEVRARCLFLRQLGMLERFPRLRHQRVGITLLPLRHCGLCVLDRLGDMLALGQGQGGHCHQEPEPRHAQ